MSSTCSFGKTCCSTRSSAIWLLFIAFPGSRWRRVSSIHVSQRDRDHFLGGGHSTEHFAHTVFAESAHAKLARLLPQEHGRLLVVDHVANVVIDHKNLEDAHPPAIAGAATMLAPDR